MAVGFQLAADSFIQILGYLIDQDTPSKCMNDAGDKLDLKPPVLGLKGAPLSNSLIFIDHIYYMYLNWILSLLYFEAGHQVIALNLSRYLSMLINY